MPVCTVGNIFAPVDTKKRSDYFQRRKVGSIRDNPKLLKIRQQFENDGVDIEKPKNFRSKTGSAPCSVNLSRKTGGVILEELFKTSPELFDRSEGFRQVEPNRRNSEGDAKIRQTVIYENTLRLPIQTCKDIPTSLRNPSTNTSPSSSESSSCLKAVEDSSSESGVHTNSSEEDSLPTLSLFKTHEVDSSVNRFFRSANDVPPIPRRGISPAVPNNFIYAHLNSETRTGKSHPSPSKSVKKTIEMYEVMCSPESKKNKSVLKREDSTSRRSFLARRHSRRNSFRKSKVLTEKPVSPSQTKQPESDGDDRNENIYQTLSTTVQMVSESHDPYDRLNRIHDMVNRIHKGQSSNCAACKAIPATVLQYSSTETSKLQVKCHEPAPHHHPPCICSVCQHSTFSCVNPPVNDEESLYYNVCCLHPPHREGWRQSRRRPVCEQNGRLCIVNCDMEKCSTMRSDELYERLSDCHSVSAPSPTPKRSLKRATVGDSCDSDGWMDVTDSDDESSLTIGRKCPESTEQSDLPHESLLSVSCDLDNLSNKYAALDISRATSTEHLYESIGDVEYDDEDSKENVSHSSQDSIKVTTENDLDSGDGSTESASSAFEDSKSSRFTVHYECQDTVPRNFMKSVLGKKVTTTPKKRRMSNFFVPWLVSSQEYGPKSLKDTLKKQNTQSHLSVPKMKPMCKNKRSQSVPDDKLSVICNNGQSEVTGTLIKNKESKDEMYGGASDNDFSIDTSQHSTRSNSSSVSSAYLRSDQLQGMDFPLNKPCTIAESTVDVNLERIRNRSASGSSEHTYILFQPIKEEEVPLYQFYERNIKERVSFCRSPKSLSPIMWSTMSESSDNGQRLNVPQFSVVEQLSPEAQDMKMLWCELPEVKDSGILERISAQELKLQEAIFDFIQSQASYIRSLKVLYEHFIRMPEFCDFESTSCVLSKHEHDVLFSDIVRVKEVSERLLSELTTRWSDGILIPDICDIIHQHAQLPTFSVYVRYCSNRVYQERTLKELKETRLCFLEVLRKLESHPVCQGLSLESFLFLPMQHISRLPLLLDNMFRWLGTESSTYDTCKMALEAVHKVFVDCNEGARKMVRLEEMFVLNRQLEFKECKVIPLISASRWLLKKGELLKLEFDKKTFGRSSRCVRAPLYLFLFNDLLVLTKRKNDDCYTVVDYCQKENVQATPISPQDLQQPVVVPNTCRYLIYLSLSRNHQGNAVELILSCTLLSERTRWLEAIQSAIKNKPCENWEYGCPQVQCVRSYIAQQPDELSLQESDVVSIHRKMNDGWYEGRRLRDGLQGWFPASYTMDIPCSRVRASNLKQCYRLLMLSRPH